MMVANLEELQELQRQMNMARQQEAAAQKLSNEHLGQLKPEEVVARLKGILYRVAPILKLTEMIQMDFGSEVLAASLRSSVRGIVDAVKWIAWQTGQNPFDKFGDDTLLIMAADLMLGDDLGRAAKQRGEQPSPVSFQPSVQPSIQVQLEDDGDREL